MKSVLIFLMLVWAPASYAMTGNQALELMFKNSTPSTAFIADIAGVMDAEAAVLLNAVAAKKAGATPFVEPYCSPPGSNAGQGAQIVYAELRNNPANNHEPVYLITRRALLNAWPCSDSQLDWRRLP